MTKIFLLDPTRNNWKTSFFYSGNCFDPIYLGYLGAYLRLQGHDVKIFQQRDEADEEVESAIEEFSPDVLGISAMTYNVDAGRMFARKVKQKNPKIRTVFGGYHATALSFDLISNPEVDYIILGEGEESLRELVSCLESGQESDIEQVKGLVHKKDGKIVFNTKRPRITNLDSLPFPERYRLEECRMGPPMIPITTNQRSFAQITGSRGCYNRCSFCTSPMMWGQKIAFRSPGNIVDEIEYLSHEFGTNSFFFTDLTFNANKEWVYQICDEILRRDVRINWSASCRATDDEVLLRKMKEAGLTRIAFGVESLDEAITDGLNKHTSLEKTISAFRISNDLGIITRAYLMIGYPTESGESIDYTKRALQNFPADNIKLAFLTPFPGTTFYEEMQKKGLITASNFDDYDTEKPIISTALTSEQLMRTRVDLLRSFYSNPKYQQRIKEKSSRFPELKPAYEELVKHVEYNLGNQ